MSKMSEDFIDIHRYPRQYENALKYLASSPISKRNKDLIKSFNDAISLIDQLSIARKIRLMSYLIKLAREYLKIDFDKATREDLKEAIKQIDSNQRYSVYTKQGYRVCLKKFYRWLEHGDDYNNPEFKNVYPERVSWISCNIKGNSIPKVSAEDILTENEIVLLLEVASEDVKREALIAVLYESGCRIGEHGSVRLRHIKKEGDCYIITVKGKTGTRETYIAKLAGILTNWLNVHPYRDNPEAPLWIKNHSMEPMLYSSFVCVIKRLAKKAGIKKRIYPHIFRHSRATHSIVQGEFTAEGAKKLFGWTPDSNMLQTYLHLTSQDVKDKYLEKLGLINKNKTSILNPKICSNCKHPNLFNASICENCQCLLDNSIGIVNDDRALSMKKFIQALSQDSYIRFRIEEMAKQQGDFMAIIESLGRS